MRPAPRRPTAALVLLVLVAGGALFSACGLLEGARKVRSQRDRPLRQVSCGVAFEMLRDSSELSILDLRSQQDFHGPLGHIHGALNVPAEDLEARLREISYLRSRTFLIYCRQQCDRPLLQLLADSGFVDGMVLHGGLEAWLDEGFGTVGAGGDGSDGGDGKPHDDKVRGIAGDPG